MVYDWSVYRGETETAAICARLSGSVEFPRVSACVRVGETGTGSTHGDGDFHCTDAHALLVCLPRNVGAAREELAGSNLPPWPLRMVFRFLNARYVSEEMRVDLPSLDVDRAWC